MILSLLWSSIFCSSILLFVINYLWKICLSMLSFLSGQVWRGNPGSHRSGMDPTPPRQSRQGAAQVGLRQCIQASLPTNRFDWTTSTFPGITRWVTWFHQHLSALPFGAAAIQSAGGVQQGGPLGPLLFATAIHTLTQDLRAGPLDIAFFCLDDRIGAGDVAAVAAALAHIRTRGSELGLTLNLPSADLPGLAASSPTTWLAIFRRSFCQWQQSPSTHLWIPRRYNGRWWFCADHPQARVEVRPLLEALSSLGDARCSARVPAMAECCMACGATRPIVSSQSYNSSTLWCKQRFPASPAFTSPPLPCFTDLQSVFKFHPPLLQVTDLQS